jgi:hypothetical protein
MASQPSAVGGISQASPPSGIRDVGNWWTALFNGNVSFKWRYPMLYFKSSLKYKRLANSFTVKDGMNRDTTFSRPFECTIDPDTGRYETLCTQAPESICGVADRTWNQTIVRHVAPPLLRIANLSVILIPPERRNNPQGSDYLLIALMWIPTVICLMFAVRVPISSNEIWDSANANNSHSFGHVVRQEGKTRLPICH